MKNPETGPFESRAKLMVSGEYLVLKGALSLALPLKFGQKLKVKSREGNPVIKWESLIKNKPWFTATIQLPDFRVKDSNLPAISETLRQILMAARELNPCFLQIRQEYQVLSEMDFDPDWGIGSGSSLISNVAYWAECDPFRLNKMIFNGSGYDIACARSTSPIIYKATDDKPIWRKANFQPDLHKHLYFVYLNHKQNTRKSISESDLSSVSSAEIARISLMTTDFEKVSNLQEFQFLMDQHEEIIGNIIRKTPIKKLLFNDFDGSVKSLGAWGGDFILAASSASDEQVRKYFAGKNLTTIFNYHEIVLKSELSETTSSQKGNSWSILQTTNS
jgi:mevalonate kinase